MADRESDLGTHVDANVRGDLSVRAAPNADQKGGAPPLNTGDIRILEAAFRGDSVWCALTTNRNWGLGNRASVHWFQIRAAASALVQEGVFGTRAAHYFYPAGCPDANGNFVLVFSRSGTGEFGSIGYTGRRSTDPLERCRRVPY